MKLPLIEFTAWERSQAKNPENLPLKLGDLVIVETEFGQEAGKIVAWEESADADISNVNKSVERFATRDDQDSLDANNRDKEKAIDYCRTTAKRYGLEMKFVDAHYSFDDQRLSFAFIAEGRVDFRELVKELSRHFQKNIRLHQLGVRDEAKMTGDVGCCGLRQCCQTHLKKLGNVTSEFAEHQQVVHRGSDRLSGICGRLKCCLAYEESYYGELIAKLPAVGTRVKTKHGRGEVIGWQVLRGSVNVRIDPEKEGDKPLIVEVPIIKKEEEKKE